MGARNYKPNKSEKKNLQSCTRASFKFPIRRTADKMQKILWRKKREIEWTGNRCQGWNKGQSKSLEDLNSERQIKLKGGNLRKKTKFKLGSEWERYDDLQVTSTWDMDREILFGRLVWFKSCKDLQIFFFVPHTLQDDYYKSTSFPIPTKPYYEGHNFVNSKLCACIN